MVLQAADRLVGSADCESGQGKCVCIADLEVAAADGATDNSEDAEAYEVRIAVLMHPIFACRNLEQTAIPCVLQQACNELVKQGTPGGLCSFA